MSLREVDALAWYEHALLVEGLVDEFTDPDEQSAVGGGSLESMGFDVRQAG